MDIIPAIDIRNGKCVRLTQGNYNQETIFEMFMLINYSAYCFIFVQKKIDNIVININFNIFYKSIDSKVFCSRRHRFFISSRDVFRS